MNHAFKSERDRWITVGAMLLVSTMLVTLSLENPDSNREASIAVGLSGLAMAAGWIAYRSGRGVKVLVQAAFAVASGVAVLVAGMWFLVPLVIAVTNIIEIELASRLRLEGRPESGRERTGTREGNHRHANRALILVGSVGFVAASAMSILGEGDFATLFALAVFFAGVVTAAVVAASGFEPTVSWRPALAAGVFLLLNVCLFAISPDTGVLVGVILSTGLFAGALLVRLKAADV